MAFLCLQLPLAEGEEVVGPGKEGPSEIPPLVLDFKVSDSVNFTSNDQGLLLAL